MGILKALDHIVIVVMLLISACIGVFFAMTGGKQRTSGEYFHGDSKLGVLPVAASIVVTTMSAITYIGTPAEAYLYGPSYALNIIGVPVQALIATTLFLPVFYRLNVTSVYTYFDMRFKRPIRHIVVVLQLFSLFIYMGIVMYTPALALATITGISLPVSILAVGVTCTFYTTIGGMKAVVWTDVFQAAVMVLSMFVMVIVGTISYGGAAVGWQRAVNGGRGKLMDFDPDVTKPYTFYTVVVGGTFAYLVNYCTRQVLVQRYNSCKTETQAKIAGALGMIGVSMLALLAVCVGMTAYAYYADCDPISSGFIDRPDQLIPYFIVEVFGNSPGIPGFLIAGAFAATLSSVSSLVNGATTIIGEDVIKMVKHDLSDTSYTLILKAISASIGTIGIALAFFATKLGSVLQAAITFSSLFDGPCFAAFCLGLFCPRANTIGAFTGMGFGLVFGFTLKIGSEFYTVSHERPPLVACSLVENVTSLPLYYENTYPNTTDANSAFLQEGTTLPEQEAPLRDSSFFSLSFFYYRLAIFLVAVSVGYIVSLLTQWTEECNTRNELYSPIVAYYPKRLLPAGFNFHSTVSSEDKKVDLDINSVAENGKESKI